MKTNIELIHHFDGLSLIKPICHSDNRGLFYEFYHQQSYHQAGIKAVFVQDNISVSHKNVIRGLHYQKDDAAQAKLISVIKGSVLDVVVDLREGSTSYLKSFSVHLSEKNGWQLFVPRGFAHGFASLEDDTVMHYKCDQYYQPEQEAGIFYADPLLKIEWPVTKPVISDKDRRWPQLVNKI